MRTPSIEPYFGNGTQYFNPERLGQRHMVILQAGAIFIVILLLLEEPLVKCVTKCSLKRCKKGTEEVNEVEDKGSDLLALLNYEELYDHYKKVKIERQKIKLLISKGKLR